VNPGSGNLYLINEGGAATVLAGIGSVTVNGGSTGGLYEGGYAGDNYLVGGTAGSTSLVGGGDGDTLVGQGGTNVLYALGNNDSLVGGLSGSSTLYGTWGDNGDTLTARDAATTLVAGPGNATLVGYSGGGNDFLFQDGFGGGSVFVSDFTVGTDSITLQYYGLDPNLAITSITPTLAGGASSDLVTLSDGTQITFQGVTGLTNSNFKLIS
jgi:hypothetical protein